MAYALIQRVGMIKQRVDQKSQQDQCGEVGRQMLLAMTIMVFKPIDLRLESVIVLVINYKNGIAPAPIVVQKMSRWRLNTSCRTAKADQTGPATSRWLAPTAINRKAIRTCSKSLKQEPQEGQVNEW